MMNFHVKILIVYIFLKYNIKLNYNYDMFLKKTYFDLQIINNKIFKKVTHMIFMVINSSSSSQDGPDFWKMYFFP